LFSFSDTKKTADFYLFQIVTYLPQKLALLIEVWKHLRSYSYFLCIPVITIKNYRYYDWDLIKQIGLPVTNVRMPMLPTCCLEFTQYHPSFHLKKKKKSIYQLGIFCCATVQNFQQASNVGFFPSFWFILHWLRYF
jgi:hypothetical protein